MLKATLQVVICVVVIFALGFTFSWCKFGGICSREEEKDTNFNGYKYCDDDCYMCNDQGVCQRTTMK